MGVEDLVAGPPFITSVTLGAPIRPTRLGVNGDVVDLWTLNEPAAVNPLSSSTRRHQGCSQESSVWDDVLYFFDTELDLFEAEIWGEAPSLDFAPVTIIHSNMLEG